MSTSSRPLKYYGISTFPSENGLQYEVAIDIAIIRLLIKYDSISSGDLKRRIEETLDRKIKPKTYYNHLNRLVNDNVLNKKDTGVRGKPSVFYSLTEEAKRRIELQLLRIFPKYGTIKHMYFHLIFEGIAKGETCSCDSTDLDKHLSEMNISRKDLLIDSIEKKYFKAELQQEIVDETEILLPFNIFIYYRPIYNIRIVQTITYYKNIIHHTYREYSSYCFSIPGIPINSFINKVRFTYKSDITEAFELLLKNGLIKPKLKFGSEMRYVLADNALDDLITDLYEFRRTIKEKEGKSEMRQAIEECQIEEVKNDRLNIINCIKRKHEKTLKEYGFLSDVIQIFCPLLFPELPYREFMHI
jgi:DNA-binding PadR family transcriptional regulator